MEQCFKQGPKFIQDHKYITALNEPIFTTLTITQQFLNTTLEKFHENPTYSLVTKGTSTGHTDGRTWSPQRLSLFYFVKNAWQMLETATGFIRSDTSPRLQTRQ